MTRIPRNISYPFLALFLFSFLVAHSYELIKSLQIPCPLSLEFSSRLIPQGTNLTITPGHTEKLNISLKGYDEDIIFEFLSDKTGPSIFKVSTIVNGQTESVSFANFFEPETFTVFVDQQTKACFIAGDKGFSLTQPLAENDYHMVINQDIPPEMADISSLVLHNGLENATLIVFSTLGGTFTIFAMIYVTSFKRANTLSNELPIKSVESITLKERLMTKVADKLERFRRKNRKTVIEQKFEQKTHTHKDDPTNTEHDNAEDFHQYYQAHTRQKIIFPENNEEDHGAGLALDMDFEDDEGRRMPTIADIKALIRDMEDKGELNCEYDPSEDTDEEDQYEAPVLPNYFCCMLCFEGKRCTVAEPCRHVFACEGCVKELVESKQTCVLCAKNITSYEPL